MIRRNKKYVYNPLKAPKAKEWLSFDEDKRIALIKAYHIKKRIQMENVNAHAAFQAVIETQAAMGDQLPTRAAIKRLMRQGAEDRHEALHAVMNVLAKYFWEGMQTDIHESGTAMNHAYEEAVRNLTLQQYYDEYE